MQSHLKSIPLCPPPLFCGKGLKGRYFCLGSDPALCPLLTSLPAKSLGRAGAGLVAALQPQAGFHPTTNVLAPAGKVPSALPTCHLVLALGPGPWGPFCCRLLGCCCRRGRAPSRSSSFLLWLGAPAGFGELMETVNPDGDS